jgi:hypothetical protein
LEAHQPLFEVFVIVGFARLDFVGLVRNVIDGIGSVNAHAALNAAAHLLAEHPRHVLFFVQIVRVLVDMREPVDAFPGQMRNGRHQIRILGLFSLIVRQADRVETIHLQLVCAVDELAVEIDVAFHFG